MRHIALVLLAVMLMTACTNYSTDEPILKKRADQLSDDEMKRMVAIMVTEYGQVVIELHPEWAPEATRNFIKLAQAGYFDGLTICEIRPQVWIRGGAPNTEECTGGPGYNIPLETPSALVNRGRVGLYHYDMQPAEGTSQFFIMLNDAPSMNGGYSIFGEVIDGMPAVDRIGKIPSTPRDSIPRGYKPLANIVINDLHLAVKR